MYSSKTQRAAMQKITVRAILDYLEKHEWRQEHALKRGGFTYRHGKTDVQAIVPSGPHTADYVARVADLVECVAEAQDEEPNTILTELLAFGSAADILEFAVSGSYGENGSVPVSFASEFYAALQKLVEAAGRAVFDATPQRHYKRIRTSETKALVDHWQLTPAKFGSYSVELVCPLENPDSDPEPEIPIGQTAFPFNHRFKESKSRKVTKLVMETLCQLKYCSENQDSAPLESDPLVNLNFYEAILSLCPEEEDIELRSSVSWSKMLEPPSIPCTTLVFGHRDFEFVAEVLEKLRPTASPPTLEVFVGSVDTLQGKIGMDGRMAGEVTIKIFSEESSRAKLDLSPDDYKVACDAHAGGHHVTFQGYLEFGRRKHRILNYSLFQMANQIRNSPQDN